MAKTKRRKRRIKIEPKYASCPFCSDKEKLPNYKSYKQLAEFITDRARIVGSERSGICSKHQRKLTTEIKRARHLGLLPFAPTM